MKRQRGFMELLEQGQGYQNRLRIGEFTSLYVPKAHANTSTLHSTESISGKECGGVELDEYNPLLDNFREIEGQQHEALIFPEGERDAVTIISNDVESLQPGGYLSGNILDFYIKYLQKKFALRTQNRFHSFNSFFFTKLVENDGVSTESEQRKAAFEKVQKWTGGVNIFDKAYVFIPVNQSSHWSLIIICHLSSLTSSPDKHECPPCILHLDSVKGEPGNLEGHIRSYIVHAWREKYHDPNVDQLLALSRMEYREVKVPQQVNHYDCGIYLLHYVELFLFESSDVRFVPNQGSLFTASWDASEVSSKRRVIRDLILELSLVSRRTSRENHTMLSRILRVRPASQISEVNEGRIEDPQNNDVEHLNAGVDESLHAGHQTTGEGALDDHQHTGIDQIGLQTTGRVASDNHQHTRIDHVVHQAIGEIALDDQQQREHLEYATSKPGKERSKRWKWSEDETSILLYCMKEGGRFCKENQAATNWNAISQEIQNQLGTDPPPGDTCRLRYDTLLKAYKKSNDCCKQSCKQFSELPLSELKLATSLTEDWYNAMDEICRRLSHKTGLSKRVKHTSNADDGGAASMSPRDSPFRTPPLYNICSDSSSDEIPCRRYSGGYSDSKGRMLELMLDLFKS